MDYQQLEINLTLSPQDSPKQGMITELPPYIYTIIAENPYPSMDAPP